MQSETTGSSSHSNNILGTPPLDSNEYGIELGGIRTSSNNDSIDSNTSSSSEKHNSIIRRFKKVIKIFECLHVETRGIERVLPKDRTDSTTINTGMIWVAANTVIPCFATGILGPAVFNLSLYDSFVTIIIFNLLGIIPVAVMACFGPASGLRTMIFSRYSCGYYGASIISIINVITAFGWGAVSSITGAQTLRVVSNDSLSLSVGIVIMALMSMVISFVGYKWIHTYTRYSWIPVFIAYCIVAGVGAKYFTHFEPASLNTTIFNNSSRRLEVTRILSFGAPCFGNAVSWAAYAADYNTYFPEDTSSLKIFLLTYMGNLLSIVPIELLGAAAYTGTYTNEQWSAAYARDNAGGLLGATLSSLGGFGKFLLTIFALSTVASNVLNVYSLSLSAQAIAPIFKRIPRFLYTVIGTAIYILLSILAANKFNDSLISFTGIVSYWFSIFIVIVFEEHLLFRRCSFKNYDFDIWNNRKVLPISLAAILSGLVGIAGIVLGMSQTWFTGPIAKAIAGYASEESADVGFEFGFIFTAIIYPLFRLIELHFVKQ